MKKRYLAVMITLVFLLLSGVITKAANEQPRFLIFHIDAVSAVDFYRLLAEGHLPNIAGVFADEGAHLRGLTLFPGGTEIIVPRLKDGLAIYEAGPVGWGYYHEEEERMTGKVETFFDYAPHVARRARGNFIYIQPILENLAALSIRNIPALLEEYSVIEYYWFSSDLYGHYFGAEHHQRSLERFDRFFGSIIPRLDLANLNIIIYGDHGMSFGEVRKTNFDEAANIGVPEELLGARYPNIYLKDASQAKEVARRIIEETTVDFTFFQSSPAKIVGFHKEATITFEGKGELIRYHYEGKDPFGYNELGYTGVYLSDKEWLQLTKDSPFPGSPPLIYRYFSHPDVGDVVTVITPPNLYTSPVLFQLPVEWIEERIGFSLTMGKGNHSGLADTDLLVPILLRGPQLQHLYNVDAMWLHQLMVSVPTLDFQNYEPVREKHNLQVWTGDITSIAPSFQLSLSPGYRLNFCYRHAPGLNQGWVEYDLCSTYLVRTWLGAGLEIRDGEPAYLLQPRLEFTVGNISLDWTYPVTAQPYELKAGLRFNASLSLIWHFPYGFGLSYSF